MYQPEHGPRVVMLTLQIEEDAIALNGFSQLYACQTGNSLMHLITGEAASK
jgi:hypothetical protein